MRRCIAIVGVGAWLTAGCGNEELPGVYWDITASGSDNQCDGSGTSYEERFEYRVIFDGNDVTLAVGEDIFATGVTDGCSLSYQSIIWEEQKGDYAVRWQIDGSASVDVAGGAGCVDDGDWEGTEDFVIVSSDHPEIAAGCTYTLELQGTWVETIE